MAVVMEKVGMIGKENSTSEVVTKKDFEVQITLKTKNSGNSTLSSIQNQDNPNLMIM